MRYLSLIFVSLTLFCGTLSAASEPKWISFPGEEANKANTWITFRRDIDLKKQPKEAIVRIAADTKYWLWINGELAIFEGGLKRGPNPTSGYYDEINISQFLKKGKNQIAFLLWHFGKEGFSHKNSGKSGLIVDSNSRDFSLGSDSQWVCCIHPAYGNTGKPYPNFRLAESNVHFDANKDMDGWQTTPVSNLKSFIHAVELGNWGEAPWGMLEKRPIPQWKNFGVKNVGFEVKPGKSGPDTIIAKLPYNMQMTPVITLNDYSGGNLININTDHSVAGSTENLRAEYITKQGSQTYESLGWMNGQRIILLVPNTVKVEKIAYRETGYDSAPEGSFTCDDDFYNLFWQKALRTLYVNMRDNYFDCPDRERAQWWGDAVLLMGESFYTYSTSAHKLMGKAILELVNWQNPDGVLHAPVPAGNYDVELPGQMLASIGRYGFWNYYMNTGDKNMLKQVYPAVKKYLSLWTLDETGLSNSRETQWVWGDWGNHRDLRLIFAGWHHIALDAAVNMAAELGFNEDATLYRQRMDSISIGYQRCWTGTAYRHPLYTGQTDDRVQALAVLAGIAPASQYPAILEVLKIQFHASPYMEKYVMEALYHMSYGSYALERTKNRFSNMVNNPNYTTLFEGWGIGKDGYGGGTSNHAWSGGAQIVIAEYICGIKPLEPGYDIFEIKPDPSDMKTVSIGVPTVKGFIRSDFKKTDSSFKLTVVIPDKTKAVISLPYETDNITINSKAPSKKQMDTPDKYKSGGKNQLILSPGQYVIEQSLL